MFHGLEIKTALDTQIDNPQAWHSSIGMAWDMAYFLIWPFFFYHPSIHLGLF
jgi:hypothetical protein